MAPAGPERLAEPGMVIVLYCGELLHVFVRQIDDLRVLVNSMRGHGLGNDCKEDTLRSDVEVRILVSTYQSPRAYWPAKR